MLQDAVASTMTAESLSLGNFEVSLPLQEQLGSVSIICQSHLRPEPR